MSLCRRNFVRLMGVVPILVVLMGSSTPSFSEREASWNFEGDEPGRIAEGFTSDVGKWEVVNDGGDQVFAQQAENRDPIFNLALLEETSYRDVDLSVRMKAVAGENEGGGGILWRAKDQDNYYLATYNPFVSRHKRRKPSFRLYKVENGKRTQLDHADAPGEDPSTTPAETPRELRWRTLRITMKGNEIVGYLDGKKLLEAEDSTFLDVGRIGLWSKSDARTYFDDLTVSTFRSPALCHNSILGWPGWEGFAETQGLLALRSSHPGHPIHVFRRDDASEGQP